jgi:3-oxo-5-alpha-steroid 4-dehydrogenase 1
VNLIPRALDHHRWYAEEFEDYPERRKALIPFLI